MSDETSAAIAERVVDAIATELRRTPWFMWDKKAQHAAIACVDAGRAAASSDLDAIKREAASKAWDVAWHECMNVDGSCSERRNHYLDRAYPAPVPEPPHVMVNGWRVRWDGAGYIAQKGMGERVTDSSALAVCWAISKRNEADTDVVRVLALREGRWDGHADA